MSDEAQQPTGKPTVLSTELSTVTISRDLLDAAKRTVDFTERIWRQRLVDQYKEVLLERYPDAPGGTLETILDEMLQTAFTAVRSDLDRRMAVEYVFGKARKSTPSQKESHDV